MIPAEFGFETGDAEVSIECVLADLSQKGCSVRIESPLTVDTRIGVLRVDDVRHDIHIEMAGRICWSRQVSIATTTYGFQFRHELPIEVFEQLIERGMISRRRDVRAETVIDLQVRRQIDQAIVTRAQLIEVSRTGVRLSTDVPVCVGERVMLTMPDGRSGVVGVVWTIQSGDGYHAGCMYQNLVSRQAIQNCLRNLPTTACSGDSTSKTGARWPKGKVNRRR